MLFYIKLVNKNYFKTSLIIIILITLLFSCSGNSVSNKETDKDQLLEKKLGDELLIVTMLYSDNSNYPYKKDWTILKEIKNRLNVELALEAVPEVDYSSRRTVVFVSGDMPDIISKTFSYDIASYTASGKFLPISKYFDQMPNFSAFIKKYDYMPDLENTRSKDGNIYFLPVNCNTQRVNSHGWLIRMDLLDEYGIELPKTFDDIYNATKIWKSYNPDKYPITSRFGVNNILSKISAGFDTIAGWSMGNMFKYDKDANDFKFAPTSDNYKTMLSWLHKMYSEGLLDVEFSTLGSTVYEERARYGEQFIMIDWIGNQNRYNLDGPIQSGNPNFNIQPFMPPKGPTGVYAGGKVPKYEQGWVINAKVAERSNFTQFLQFLDWMYSEEAAELTTFGLEGESFQVLADGRKEYIDFTRDYTVEMGINQNCLTVRRDDDFFASNKTQYVIDLFTQMDKEGVFKPQDPSLKLSDQEKDEESLYRSSLQDYVDQMTLEFIFGRTSLDKWPDFVAECEAKGRPELDKLYNAVWKNQQ